MDLNSGVYLSAVKPTLEQISKGWQSEVLDTKISCEDVSDRIELSGRQVCTKLVLFLLEKYSSPQKDVK